MHYLPLLRFDLVRGQVMSLRPQTELLVDNGRANSLRIDLSLHSRRHADHDHGLWSLRCECRPVDQTLVSADLAERLIGRQFPVYYDASDPYNSAAMVFTQQFMGIQLRHHRLVSRRIGLYQSPDDSVCQATTDSQKTAPTSAS